MSVAGPGPDRGSSLMVTDESGGRLYHWLDDALTFVVYPPGDERGVVRLEGRWEKEEIGAPAETL